MAQAVLDTTAPTAGGPTVVAMAVGDPMVAVPVVEDLVAAVLAATPNAKDHIASLYAFSPHQNVILLLQLDKKINQSHAPLTKFQGKHRP